MYAAVSILIAGCEIAMFCSLHNFVAVVLMIVDAVVARNENTYVI